MKKSFYLFGIVSIFFGLVLFANAASIFDITYPIAELGGCASQQECKVYCDDLVNKDQCLDFAEKFGLVAKEKVEAAKKLPALGPGGCKSAGECRAYCDNPDNEEACLAFAEKYGMKAEGPRGQDVSARARLIKEQGGPGNCQSQKECRAYCETPANQKECLDFAEKHNLIDKREIKAARKVMESGGPGGCRSKDSCEAYCENPDNMMECVKFAEEHDLIDAKEAEMIKKMPSVGPGGCRGKECRTYCDNPDHAEECLSFAEKNGLMPKEELERAKKLAGKPGPGGCRGQKECNAFCGNPDNQEICFQFAIDNDLMPHEEIERAKKMKEAMKEGGPGGCKDEKECRAYCENPENQEKCFEFAKENHLVGEKEIKMMERGREMMKKAREAGGPGGCKEAEECIKYCSNPEHRAECARFNPSASSGQVPSVGASPPGEMFRQIAPGAERDFRRDGAEDTPFGEFKRGVLPERSDSSACSREYHPVCGTNNRTYPNECFAKKDNILVAKEGICGESSNENFNDANKPRTPFEAGIIPPDGAKPIQPSAYPQPDQLKQYQPERPSPYIPQYTQPSVVPEQPIVPQSRNFGGFLLSNIINAFSNALRMR